MNSFRFLYAIFFAGLMLLSPVYAYAEILESRYATIIYYDQNDFKQFHNKLCMGQLQYKNGSGIVKAHGNMIEDEVIYKIDFIVEKVMKVLDMFPPHLKFSITIYPGEKRLQQEFRKIYNIDVDYVAFYSPSKNKVCYSANNASLKVVAHEIAHAVAQAYFTVSPPQRIHELMAQFAEYHIAD